MIVFLKGYVTVAQPLGSLVNKLDLKTSGTEYSGGCTFEEAMDIIFGKDLSSSDYVPAGRSGTGYWSETVVCLKFVPLLGWHGSGKVYLCGEPET